MRNRPKTSDVLADNLRALMDATGIKKQKLAKESKVSERMIGYILAKERTPTIDVVDALAAPFGLSGWHLLILDLPIGMAKNGQIGKLMHLYSRASDEGRKYIDRVAEHEAQYKTDAKDQ